MFQGGTISVKIVVEKDLRGYFFEELKALNLKSGYILSDEIVLYSSDVLSRLSLATHFFEIENPSGRLKEKILGIKLLEAGLQDADKKRHSLRDIGDTSLVLCGLFAEASAKKISDLGYYQNIGKIAYDQLDSMITSVYDVDHFYRLISRQFDMAVSLLCNFKKQGLERAPDRFVLQLNQSASLNKKAV